MAIKNTLSASSTRKYLPYRVITGFSSTITGLEGWLYDDGMGDPWWQGASGSPCRWMLTATVDQVNHSSHLTRVPNIYNGFDIVPGMWVYADGEGKAVRIVSIVNKTEFEISCIVEDVDRYNTFTDKSGTGTGIFSTGRGILFFELGDDGLPVLNPLPDFTDIASVSQVEARFRVFNPVVETRFFQLQHGFEEGQVLKLDAITGLFKQAKSDDFHVVGTVTAVGPGPNYFYLEPSTKIIVDLEPGLPGTAGDVIWLDPTTGDRSTSQNGSSTPLYIKMTNEVESFSIGSLDEPVTWDGTKIKLNNHNIVFSNPDGPIDTASMISIINEHTEKTGVVASMGSPTNIIVGSAMYATSTLSDDMKFELNGFPIIVAKGKSIVYGESDMIGWWDVIRSINEQTNNHGVYGSFDSNTGFISFEHAGGGSIKFVNVYPELTSGNDMTVTDMIGILEDNPASTPSRLKLTRPDGGQIIISDVMGTFTQDTGVHSAANGKLPLALVVTKSMNATSNFMVADIPAMNALTNIRSGDQVFVQNGVTPGEWELYVRTGEVFTKISDYDSASTDSKTLSIDVDFNSVSPILLGNISDGTRIVNVSVVVTEEFSDDSVLSVGVIGQPEAIMSSSIIDLTVNGSYESGTSFMYSGDEDGEVHVFVDASGSVSGKAKIIVSYM